MANIYHITVKYSRIYLITIKRKKNLLLNLSSRTKYIFDLYWIESSRGFETGRRPKSANGSQEREESKPNVRQRCRRRVSNFRRRFCRSCLTFKIFFQELSLLWLKEYSFSFGMMRTIWLDDVWVRPLSVGCLKRTLEKVRYGIQKEREKKTFSKCEKMSASFCELAQFG